MQIATTAGDDGAPRIGVTPETKSSRTRSRSTIPIENIGGPSAGLMFTLGIIDKLKPEDLTGGKIIAGTGTIDDDGQRRPDRRHPAEAGRRPRRPARTFFLTPADNCAEAVANASAGPAAGQGGDRWTTRSTALARHPGRRAADRCCSAARADAP